MKSIPVSILGVGFAALLTGCSASFDPSFEPSVVPVGEIHGAVHGGQAPITGSRVYLYAVGTGGIGTAATSLLKSAANTTFDGTNYYVLTDAKGNFTLTGDYTCTSGQQVYLYSVGGNSGSSGGANSEIGLLAYVGVCPATQTLASTVPTVISNEISTVVAAYALAGFATSPTAIGAGSSAAAGTGLANAGANVGNVLAIGYGLAYNAAPGSLSTSTVPLAKINMLADILGACINSISSVGTPSAACTTLFNNTKNSAGVAPTDTAQAAINMAHNQAPSATAISSLYGLITATAPFLPYTASAPADLAIPVTYTMALTSTPTGMAIDNAGKVWIAGAAAGAPIYSLTPQGVATSHAQASGTSTVKALAISPYDGTIWTFDGANSTLRTYTAAAAINLTVPYTGASATAPIAFDTAGNGALSSTYSGSNYYAIVSSAGAITTNMATTLGVGSSLAITGGNVLWVGGSGASNLLSTASPYTVSAYTAATAVTLAATSGGYVWHLTNGNSAVLRNTTAAKTTCNTVTGFSGAVPMAVDGAGSVWVGNQTNLGSTSRAPQTVAGMTSACTAKQTTSAIDNGRSSSNETPYFVSADAAGNLWTFNGSKPGTGNPTTSVTQFLGLVTPTATPVSPATSGLTP